MKTERIYPIKLLQLFLPFILLLAISCNPQPAVQDFSVSPVVAPDDAIEKMEIETGFEVELVAAEPLLNAPVTMTFDEKGRIWIVEMESFMLDTVGTGEDKPTGKVSILEDKDGDGVYENKKVFLDSLVLPRAISLFSDGVLVAEPPYLWYVSNNNDQPGGKILVDAEYAIGGNAEHQPNTLLRGLDNWIYNAKSDKRYKRKGNEWIIEKTHFRGQWGIAQDDYGRLYYNHNSANVLGEYFTPGFGSDNSNQRKVAGFNEAIVPDNRVYPSRPTTGVNRGYMDGILDSTKRLVNFTAASALTIYRGDLFGNDYTFNAFVPEPAANLIKRNILKENGNTVEGEQAYEDNEFLRSVDERFRPVMLSNGPDGALYVVDMYRGIIQHKTYLTPYLKEEIEARGLEQPTEVGRIYRIVPVDGKREMTIFPQDAQGLVQLLSSSNGWVRDKAQQIIIDRNLTDAIPVLRNLLKDPNNPLPLIHSLWTLEGLGVLTPEDVSNLFSESDFHIKTQAFSAMTSIINKDNYITFVPYLDQMIDQKNATIAPYIAFVTERIEPFNEALAGQLLNKLVQAFPNDKLVADAVVSGLYNKEAAFLKQVESNGLDTSTAINKSLTQTIKDIIRAKDDVNTRAAAEKFPQGAMIYNRNCATCHGRDGYGIESLAPALNKSDWALGNKDKVIATVLFGLSGPIVINGETKIFAGDMPGIGQSSEFTNSDIAQVISFIRNAWSNSASSVSEEEVAKIREQYINREGAFTQEEMDKIWKRN
jgi:mono/diheme cytochrome c family protein